jgi:polyisoprenoid-binding protein YceI
MTRVLLKFPVLGGWLRTRADTRALKELKVCRTTDIKVAGDGELKVQGDLIIRGATRKVRFAPEGPTSATKDPWGNTRIGISATTKINRKDFGLTWNTVLETGGILVGDEVTITLDVEFIKA